jgi:hypothetical protein
MTWSGHGVVMRERGPPGATSMAHTRLQCSLFGPDPQRSVFYSSM